MTRLRDRLLKRRKGYVRTNTRRSRAAHERNRISRSRICVLACGGGDLLAPIANELDKRTDPYDGSSCRHLLPSSGQAFPLGDNFMISTPQQITEQLLALVKIGAHRFTIHFSDASQADGALLFAATVPPHLQDI